MLHCSATNYLEPALNYNSLNNSATFSLVLLCIKYSECTAIYGLWFNEAWDL